MNLPARCIFCGALAVTREHMWADWLRNYIPRQQDGHAVAVEKVHLEQSEEEVFHRTGDPHSRRIKCVCRECNNGWMSRLQETTKPYLVPMLGGRTITLKRNGMTALAAWAAMFVMVAEHLRDEMVAISAYDRNFLRTKMRPPSHWRIWIGRHAAVSHPLFSHNVLSFALEQEIQQIGLEASVPVNTQTSTILLGKHLLIYVMSSAVARNIIRRWVLPDLVRSHLAQIWPIVNATATWPPNGLALRDPVIHALAQHFFRAGNTLAKERVLRL
jgi:hypothetical protein